MNKIKYKFILLFPIIFIGAFFSIASPSFAATLNIVNPAQNEKISGSYSIGWSVFNTGMASIPYEIRIKNASCSDSGIAIAGNNFSASVQNGSYVQPWNSQTVNDGLHCLQLCIRLADDSIQCTHRVFNVVNQSNNAPVITSYPSRLSYKSNEVFEYRIQAYDPDGDNLVYKLLVAPDFIFLDQDGRMGLGNYMTAGTYNISFAVIDPYGKSTQQSFVLNVTNPTPTPVPTRTTSPNITPKQQPTNVPVQPEITEPVFEEINLVIITPNKENILSGTENEVSWELSEINADNYKELIVEYSKDSGNTYSELFKSTEFSSGNYNWDVSELENGEYSLRIRIINSENETITQRVSENFLVGNSVEEGKVLSILALTPENKGEITDSTPIISADFAPSDDAEIEVDSVEIKLNGKKITKDCSIDKSGFECEILEILDYDEHSVQVELKDSNGQTLNQSWIFYIVEDEGNNDPVEEDKPTPTPKTGSFFDDIDIDELKNYFPWCGGILLILLLVFFVSVLRKKKDYGNSYSSSTDTFATPMGTQTSSDSFPVDDNEDFDFSIGNHEVAPSEIEDVKSQLEGEQQEDIPDWLKGDTSDGAQPVGGTDPLPSAASNEGSQVHDNFGLTPVDSSS